MKTRVLSLLIAVMLIVAFSPTFTAQAALNVLTYKDYPEIASYFDEGIAKIFGMAEFAPGMESYSYGFMDITGKVIVPLGRYTNAGRFSDGLAPVEGAIINGYVAKGPMGFVDKTGKEVIPCDYQWQGVDFAEGNGVAALTKYWDGKRGVIDKTGKVIVPFGKYDKINHYHCGVSIVGMYSSGKYDDGAIDSTGKEIIPVGKYDSVELLSDWNDGVDDNRFLGYFKVGVRASDGEQYGLVDTAGKEIIPPKYDNLMVYKKVHLFKDTTDSRLLGKYATDGMLQVYTKANGWSAVDSTGKETFSLEKYADLLDYSDGRMVVTTENDNYGVIDIAGREIVSPKYTYISTYSEGLASFRREGFIGYLDMAGQEVLIQSTYLNTQLSAYVYEHFGDFHDGLAIVCVRYPNPQGTDRLGWGYIDKTGKFVIPSIYSQATDFNDGAALVSYVDYIDGDTSRVANSGSVCIDRTGKELVPRGKYDYGFPFQSGVAWVVKNGKSGVINAAGQEIIPCEYARFEQAYVTVGKLVTKAMPPDGEGVFVFDGVILGERERNGGSVDRYLIVDPLDTASTWAKSSIADSVAKNLVPDALQNKYTAVLTRAEFCRLAVKFVETYHGKTIDAILTEKGLKRGTFSDTTDATILAAAALKIVSGGGNGAFNPNGTLTRQEAATMINNILVNVLGINASKDVSVAFGDRSSIASWAQSSVAAVSSLKIMNGDGKNFNPRGTYTRQEGIITFSNFYSIVNK
ncbi:hypothetical protein FACS1894208_00970 [Clostridia bacterium]|nr:hypothetical protein FACS1894208_00970 [Clostridia bacterium]